MVELQLEEAEANAAEDELAAEHTKPATTVKILRAQAAGAKTVPGSSPA